MEPAAALVAIALLLGAGGPAAGQDAIPLLPMGSLGHAGGYTIDLGEADDPHHARAWQGPLSITGPTGFRCTASDAVAIIERPLALLRGHVLARRCCTRSMPGPAR